MTQWPWPEPDDGDSPRHLQRGQPLPDLALPATTGTTISISRLTGRTVAFFYPWTGRPGVANPPGWDQIPGAHGSTPEAEGFRESYSKYTEFGFEVLGVSMQPPEEQQEFATRLALPYPLLSDQYGTLSGSLRLPSFEAGGTVYLKRLTLVVANGLIERVVYPVHPPDTHPKDLLAELRPL